MIKINMNLLELSMRCMLFKEIAERTWLRIIRKHHLGINDKEIAITNDIIADILEYHDTHLQNFDVYAKDGYLESKYGSDIDVFIETNANQYKWFALQAKLLKKNNRYDTLRDGSGGVMQWDKLALLKSLSGCTPFYLLYNGKKDYKYKGKDQCNKEFEELQFGCSLVAPDIIKRFATTKGATGRYINPRFEDIHPNYAEPWRVLVCCYQNIEQQKLYSLEEINESNPYLKLISKLNLEERNESIDSNEIYKNEAIANESNEIYFASKKANWNPGLRIIIHRSGKFDR